MGLVGWNEKYSVKVDQLDADHQQLFRLIDELYDAMKSGKGKSQVVDTVNRLKDYSVYHFKKEEEMLAKINYQGLAEQKAEHRKFIQKVDELQTKANQGGVMVLSVEVSNFMNEWLKSHIMSVDKEYSGKL